MWVQDHSGTMSSEHGVASRMQMFEKRVGNKCRYDYAPSLINIGFPAALCFVLTDWQGLSAHTSSQLIGSSLPGPSRSDKLWAPRGIPEK